MTYVIHQMEENQPKKKLPIALSELQSLITISYGVAVGIGMLFQYNKYALFGINIFEYADVFDFLIAPFSDPKILLYTLIAVGAAGVGAAIDTLWKTKLPKSYTIFSFGMNRKKWFPYQQIVLFIMVVGIYLDLSAEKYAEKAFEEITQQATITIRFNDNEQKQILIIGKTNEVLFAKEDNQVKIIPINSLVKEYEIVSESPADPEEPPTE